MFDSVAVFSGDSVVFSGSVWLIGGGGILDPRLPLLYWGPYVGTVVTAGTEAALKLPLRSVFFFFFSHVGVAQTPRGEVNGGVGNVEWIHMFSAVWFHFS